MPDPLTVLLDAVEVEAAWWWYRMAFRNLEADSISGRNVFWVEVMERQ